MSLPSHDRAASALPKVRFALPLIAAILIAPAFPARSAPAEAPLPVRYEAEDQALADGAIVITNTLASGGQAVVLGTSGSVQWTVVTPAAGRYELWLRYRATKGDEVARLIVNGRDLGLGLPFTREEWGEISAVRTLAAGTNTIILRADWPGAAVDYLRFGFLGTGQPYPLVELPVVSPRNNVRYVRNPADTCIHVDLGGHRLLGIREAGRSFKFTQHPCDYLDDAVFVQMPALEFSGLKRGIHRLTLQFDQDAQVPFELEMREQPEKWPWTIVTLDVNHGGATFMRLPTGKTLLLDTAKAVEADRVVIPFLASNRIARLDYLIITHGHEDHVGGLPEIQKRVAIGQRWDNRSFKSGDDFEVDGVQVKVLNAFENGTDENTRSLALRFEYHGFVYSHGADIYAANQVRQVAQFTPEILRSHVYHGNHHLHGSVDVGFFRTLDPVLVLISADQAVYARGAFSTIFKQHVEGYLKRANGRFREALITHDVGHIILRIADADHWTCETTRALEGIVLR
jgi:beta-lactamase superfamily II metal-dependent hydrolase